MRKLIALFTLATAAKKPPPKRVALVSFAAPWDYGPYAHQLRELAEHWREPGVPRRFHAIDACRLRERRRWVVSRSILRLRAGSARTTSSGSG